MKFISVSFKNFYRWGPEEQTLDLSGTGVYNISAPNGYGKSSIIEAIVYSLYGKTKQDSVDDVVNRYIGKDCKVSVEFEEDGKRYKVIRYRKHTTHGNSVYVFENDKDISMKGIPETNQEILDIIKMPYIAFVNSTIFSSELYTAFLGAHESDRLQIFENILSLKEVSLFYAETKNILKELSENKEKLVVEQTAKETEITTLDRTVADYKAKAKASLISLKERKESDERVIKDLEEKKKEYGSINIEEEKAKLNNIPILEQYKKDLLDLRNRIVEVKSDSQDYKEAVKTIEKYKDTDFDVLIKNEKEYNSDKESDDDSMVLLNKADNKIIESKSKEASFDSDIKNLEEKKSAAERDILSSKESRCSKCGHILNEEENNKQKEEAEKSIKDILSKISSLNALKEEAEKVITAQEAEKSIYSEEHDNFINKWKDIKIISGSENLKEKYHASVNFIKAYEEKKNNDEKHNAEINAEIAKTEEKIKALKISDYSESFINNLSDKMKEADEGIEKCKEDISSINGSVSSVYDKSYVENIEKDIKTKKDEDEKISSSMNDLNDSIFHYSYLSEVFSNKSGGFKKYFISEMIDIFNQKVNQYLPFFFVENISINFDKDLKETIKMDDYEISFSSFSNGQKCRAELSIAFALFSISRIFFSNDNSLLVVDEMLDDGLDEYGIKAAISVLNAFADEAKIFIVSHNPLIKENIENVIEIKRDENNFSILA